MTNISKTLKSICKRQKVFGVVVSSLSRATEGRADHRPIMSDLRETGQLEFDADKIAFVYRPHQHDDAKPEDLMEVIVRKNRNGMLGLVHLSRLYQLQVIEVKSANAVLGFEFSDFTLYAVKVGLVQVHDVQGL